MIQLAPLVDVTSQDRPGFRRVAGLTDANDGIVVGLVAATGEATGQSELVFTLAEAQRLCEAVLAGDQRAKTMPGLARILSATAAVLFRVANAAGALEKQQHEGSDGRGDDRGDRAEAAGDADPGE